MDELFKTSFQIIAVVGGARSAYVEAVRAAREGDFNHAEELMKKGDEKYLAGHDVHAALIQREAGGDPVNMTLIISHAEDQLMAAESFKLMAQEFIEVYRHLFAQKAEQGVLLGTCEDDVSATVDL
ncbi:MAG: PTS lactose/cellobiose transporter subunit IIA [Olsenella sp.]|jgi:PTS system cellobiose-specific IIA component|nr:PTS lactose/cellobiose transporter subunit IIA [Olsenella sp.]MCI1645022.1 PTS lactose/cellobiose transporter subunit IIA [Olsenella sp.]MCI1792855.1 PTS lactose/cellobiose transporter subunit IIA [Olsenella sp.]MCI1810650.1 PTS lactose/cellobiose transporter subunit IIA [Olsenella sp.]MCI2123678.1 PTS lactose/cellobiose transporter subunit IIA [Olsenella sp.]